MKSILPCYSLQIFDRIFENLGSFYIDEGSQISNAVRHLLRCPLYICRLGHFELS